MARKKKNKKEQTFNVYPYLGGYQHFMKGGGALPKFEEDGQVNIQDVVKHIRPTNKYKYDRTFGGVRDEWRNNVGFQGDRDKYNSLGGLGSMGLMANLFKGAGDLIGDVRGAFNKDSYKPGGKYSKFDLDGGLRYGNVKLTNTTDQNALLHGENFAKYLNMSNKERKKLTESGDLRNTDLWWSTDDLKYGKYNWMDRNEDGTAKFDGINYQVAKKRSEHYRNPDQGTCSKPEFTNGADCEANGGTWTGDKLFSIKQRNKDGTFTYFNEDGSVDGTKSGQTEYDIIEESQGTGGLGDVNAETMIFDFDKEGDNKLAGFTSYDETTTTKSTCSDGTSLTEEDCIANGGTWKVDEPTTDIARTPNEYDPESDYGPHTKTTVVQEESEQQKLNREAIEKGEKEEDAARYGRELRKMWIGGDGIMGGLGQDDLGGTADFKTNFHQFDIEGPIVSDSDLPKKYDGYQMKYGGSLQKFANGGAPDEEETVDEKEKRLYEESLVELPPSEMDMRFDNPATNFTPPTNDLYSFAPTNEPIDLQPEPESTWEEPSNVDKFKNWFKGDAHLNKDPGPDFSGHDEMMESITEKNEASANNPRVLDPANRTEMEGAAPEGSDNLGVDVNYGDGPIQSTWNKARETLQTGPIGAAGDIFGKASAFVVDKAVPFLEDIFNRNVNKQNEMFKRSISAEDVAPMMEETAGTGSKGYANVNYGGYGDSLYGTGKVYGQVQQGQELMEQQPDLSGVTNFMEPTFDGLKYKDEYLSAQKTFLGEMKNGAELPKAQPGGGLEKVYKGGKWVWNGIKFIWQATKPVNPLAFNPLDNVFFSTGYVPPMTKIDFTKTPVSGTIVGDSENIGFLNLNNAKNAPSSVEMISVLDEYRNTGIGTYLYGEGVKATASNKYPGLISGETLDNPEATVSIWKHFNLQTQNKKGEWVDNPNPSTGLSTNIDTKKIEYSGSPIKLMGTNLSGDSKIADTKKFYNELGIEESSIFNTDITQTAGKYNFNSPLWRGIKSNFTKKNLHIGDGKKPYSEYNKWPLFTIPAATALGTYAILSRQNNIDPDYEKEYKEKRNLKQANEAGFETVEEYMNHLKSNAPRTKEESDIYNEYKDSMDFGIYEKGGQLRKYLKGGNTAQSSAICDAYDKPVGPTNPEFSKADYSTPVLPYDDMKYGGALPRYKDEGEKSNWNLSGWLKGEQGFIPDYKGESTKTTISENKTLNKTLDNIQTGAGGVGLTPGAVGLASDATNTGISAIRAWAAPDGSDQKLKHQENMAINATAMIPGPMGWAAGTAGLTKDVATQTGVIDDQSIVKNVTDSIKDNTTFAENMQGDNKVGSSARYGGEEVAEIDMELYYELMKAGANIQIIR